MEKNAAPGKPCPDCESLKSGTRSSRDPHQYLVLTGKSADSPSNESYRCLVCTSDLSLERRGSGNFWS